MALKQNKLERELRKAGVSKKKSGQVAERLLGKTKSKPDKTKPKKRLGRLRKHAPHLKLKRGKSKRK